MISYFLYFHPRSKQVTALFDNRILVGIFETQQALYHAVGKQTPDEIVGEGPDPEAPEWQLDQYEQARLPHIWNEATNYETVAGIYEYQIIGCSVEQIRSLFKL